MCVWSSLIKNCREALLIQDYYNLSFKVKLPFGCNPWSNESITITITNHRRRLSDIYKRCNRILTPFLIHITHGITTNHPNYISEEVSRIIVTDGYRTGLSIALFFKRALVREKNRPWPAHRHHCTAIVALDSSPPRYYVPGMSNLLWLFSTCDSYFNVRWSFYRLPRRTWR